MTKQKRKGNEEKGGVADLSATPSNLHKPHGTVIPKTSSHLDTSSSQSLTPYASQFQSQKKRKVSHGQSSSSTSVEIQQRHISPPPEPLDMVNAPTPASDDTIFVTPDGTLVNLQTAGFVLSNYLQSYGGDPAGFRSTSTFTVVPSPNPINRKRTETPLPPLDSLFHCTITLPSPCPLRTTSSPGNGYRSKDLAKKHAQLEFVRALFRVGELGPDLKPKQLKKSAPGRRDKHYERVAEHVQRQLSSPISPMDPVTRTKKIENFKTAMAERLPSRSPAASSIVPGQADYYRIPHPSFWNDSPRLRKHELYPVIIELQLGAPFEARTKECRVMCLITSRPLPIFGGSLTTEIDNTNHSAGMHKERVEATVRLVQGKKMKKWDDGKLEQAMKFTERVVRAHAQKPLISDLDRTRWIIVPMRPDYEVRRTPGFKVHRKDIAWEEISQVADHLWTPFSVNDPDRLEEEIADAMSTPRAEFSQRCYLTNLRRDLKPSSLLHNNPQKTIQDLQKRKDELAYPDQCILEATQAHSTRSGGFIVSLIMPHLGGRLLIPESTHRHSISASVHKATSILPTFFSHLDDLVLAQEFSQEIFAGTLRADLALLAISCPLAHSLAPLRSYQRLEMLGDTLLKFLVAIYLLYRTKEISDWEKLHQDRQIMVSNRTLMVRAIECGVVPYIRGVQKPRDWVPVGWKLEGRTGARSEGEHDDKEGDKSNGDDSRDKATKDEVEKKLNGAMDNGVPEKRNKDAPDLKQLLGDKTIADVAEALVAASYLSNNRNIDSAISAMHTLGIPIEGLNKWTEVRLAPAGHDQGNTKGGVNVPPLIFLQYEFSNPQNGRDAITMSPDRHQRATFIKLKILGDAVLDYYLVEHLFDKHPESGPGQLTIMRHSRHGDACLAAFCVVSGIIDAITDIPLDVMPEIKKYKKAVMASKKIADAAEDDTARIEFWADVPVFAFAGDIINALLGAMLMDSSYNLKILKSIYHAQVLPFFERYCVGPTTTAPHPRDIWSQMVAKRGCRRWEMSKAAKNARGFYVVKIHVHDHQVARVEAETQILAIRKVCEEAVNKAKSENILDTVCTCPRRKKGRATEPAGVRMRSSVRMV